MQQADRPGRRWLLPFTCHTDLAAIDAALRLANTGNATLVIVSLIVLSPEQDGYAVPFEMLQQSKDFLATMRRRAFQMGVAIETLEGQTTDVPEHLTRCVTELNCHGVILATRGKEALFLHEREFQALLLHPPAALVLIRFPTQGQEGMRQRLFHRIRTWWRNRQGRARAFLIPAASGEAREA